MNAWRGPILLGLVLAAGLGVLAALLLAPRIDPHAQVIARTCDADPAQRSQGWKDAQRLDWNQDQWLRLEEALLAAPPEATLDAAEHPWFVPQHHPAAFARRIAHRNPRRVLAWMAETTPLPLASWSNTASILLASPDAAIRDEALETLLKNADSRSELLALLPDIHPDGERQRAVLTFALGLSEQTPQALLTETGVTFEDEEDVARIRQAARQVIRRKRSDIELRRYAAWRIDELDDGTTAGLLAPAPADDDGSVLATAMIAKRHLSPNAAQELVDRWLVDFEVDRRRAAALLAVLMVNDPEDLTQALFREKDPTAKRTMRLALGALDAWPNEEVDQATYTARTMRLDDGRLDPDAAFLRMLSGDPQALAALSTHPRLPITDLSDEDRARWRRAITWRQWALAWMVPQWHLELGEPVASEQTDLLKRLDMVEALRLTQSEDLTWDPSTRRWQRVAKDLQEEDHGQP